MSKILCLLCLLCIVVTPGCLKKSDKDSDTVGIVSASAAAVQEVEQYAPAREQVKSDILSEITKKENTSRQMAPGNYYFSLSKRNTTVTGDTAAVVYSFIYTENYGNPAAATWNGRITYNYVRQTDSVTKWVVNSTAVEFGVVQTGTITGIVKNKITSAVMAGVDVYAKAGEEQTVVVKTDAAGVYTIPEVLENTYTVYVLFPEFDIGTAAGITVTEGNASDAGIIELIPSEDERYATIEGYVYYDAVKSRPVSGAAVWIEYAAGGSTPFLSTTTDEAGKYEIPFITAGNFKLFARIENLYTEAGIPFSVSADQTLISTKIAGPDVIMENQVPVINGFNPATPYTATAGETLNLNVSATDADNDLLYYEWSVTAGQLDFSIDNTASVVCPESGAFQIFCDVTDRKGGKATQVWDVDANPVTQDVIIIQEASTTLMGVRYAPGNIVFDGKMWIFGGSTSSTISNNCLNDIWTSVDGINWIEVTSDATFGHRATHKVIEFNSELYLIGGYDDDADTWSSEVFKSTDGIHWTSLGNAPFSSRGFFGCVVFNGEIWVIGGGGVATDTVWSSADGVNWTSRPVLPDPVRYIDAVVYNGKIWFVGGEVPGSSFVSWILSCDASGNWTRNTASPLTDVTACSIYAKNGKLWVACGGGNSSSRTIWQSIDGENWDPIVTNNDLLKRWFHATFLFNSKVYYVGGAISNITFLSDVVSSNN